MDMLSIIIPCYKEPYLQQMIDGIFESATGDIEIIPVFDSYWQDPPLKEDPRIKIVHLGKNRGMRGSINAGVAVSKGEYIMRVDAHCIFGKGFDTTLTESMQDNWIMTARRYFLDPVKWEIMDIPPVDYEKLVIQENKKFSGQRWRSRSKLRRKIAIDETMAMQGSCWIMKRTWWDKIIGELQTEGYGPLYQDSHEVTFKTWKAGGKLMLNKNTWFAHKHRSFPRTHNYGRAEATPGWTYSLNLWRDYYENEIRPKWGI